MSKTYQVKSIIEGNPTFEKPLEDILAELKVGGAIKLLDPLEYITDRQRRYYKGVVLPALVFIEKRDFLFGRWDSRWQIDD